MCVGYSGNRSFFVSVPGGPGPSWAGLDWAGLGWATLFCCAPLLCL